ncbi:MAG: DUF1146 domain-containing protein [Solobacterium sp.]|nr:DUF1146 domain-containing protein [Solobacterium sp.]
MGFASFAMKAGIYLIAFMASFYALGALDFNRFLKQGRPVQGQLLYWLLAMGLAYLSGSFLIAVTFAH